MERVAFKVPQYFMSELIGIDDVSPDQSNLIGLQFELKNPQIVLQPWPPIDLSQWFPPYLAIYKVYYDSSVGPNENPFSRSPENDSSITIGNGGNIYVINEDQEPYTLSDIPLNLMDILNVPIILNGNPLNEFNLDYYDSNDRTAYVYFTIDQIEPLVRSFSEIVISGAEMTLGKKLGVAIYSLENGWIYPETAFTLKMEGAGAAGLGLNDTSGVRGPAVTLGQPCPPDWYTFNIVFNNLRRQHPNENLHYVNLLKSWIQAIHIGPISDAVVDLIK